MSDTNLRELLELAAKAIGGILSEGHTKRRIGATWDDWEWIGGPGITTPATWKPYGSVTIYPHLDDGDSRRLQLACGLDMQVFHYAVSVLDWDFANHEAHGLSEHFSDHGDDAAAAARMAVLRAAAEMGRRMP